MSSTDDFSEKKHACDTCSHKTQCNVVKTVVILVIIGLFLFIANRRNANESDTASSKPRTPILHTDFTSTPVPLDAKFTVSDDSGVAVVKVRSESEDRPKHITGDVWDKWRGGEGSEFCFYLADNFYQGEQTKYSFAKRGSGGTVIRVPGAHRREDYEGATVLLRNTGEVRAIINTVKYEVYGK